MFSLGINPIAVRKAKIHRVLAVLSAIGLRKLSQNYPCYPFLSGVLVSKQPQGNKQGVTKVVSFCKNGRKENTHTP